MPKDSPNLYDDSDSVYELDPEDFIRDYSGMIKVNHPNCNGKYGFLMFYSHTCPHCTDMVDTWNALGTFLDDDVTVSAFNCKNGSSPHYAKIRELANIQYFPTIKFVRPDGSMIAYSHGRSKEELLRFLCNRTSKFCK